MSKKKLVTLAVGDEYQRLERVSGPSRREYAKRHGWQYEVIERIPDSFRQRFPGARFGWVCNLYKLLLPELNQEYDLVAYMDNDSVVSPRASCLSSYSDQLPSGGFAAVQTVHFAERARFHPEWAANYYAELPLGDLIVRNVEAQINGGLLLFRPREVRDAWTALLNSDTPLNEENRLNAHEVQAGRCLFLPGEWNLLWMYEKYRLGILRPQRNPFDKLWNRAYNRYIGKWHERARMNDALNRCFMLHLAFEHRKIHWLRM